MRLMWSLISTGVPGVQVSSSPPQPLVSTIVAAAGGGGGAHAVHDGGDALALVEVGAARGRPAGSRSPARTERILPAWPATAGGAKPGRSVVLDLGGRLAEGVDGRQPAGAQHQGDVVALDAGQLGERRRRPRRRSSGRWRAVRRSRARILARRRRRSEPGRAAGRGGAARRRSPRGRRRPRRRRRAPRGTTREGRPPS